MVIAPAGGFRHSTRHRSEPSKQSLDLSDAFHESVAVVDRLEEGVYGVDGTISGDDRAMAEGLRELRAVLDAPKSGPPCDFDALEKQIWELSSSVKDLMGGVGTVVSASPEEANPLILLRRTRLAAAGLGASLETTPGRAFLPEICGDSTPKKG